MIASKKIERLPDSAARLTVTVGAREGRAEYDALLAEYAKKARIDGFRKGKVPVNVLERKFGEEMRVEAMGRILEKGVEEALKDEALVPLAYSSPALEGEPRFELDQDFTYSVTYDVFPEVKPGDWKGIEIEIPQAAVTKADEDRELQEIRERNAVVVDKDSTAAVAKGDIITVDYRELAQDGSVLPGTERQDFVFEVGTGYNLFKFDDDVIGMKKGDEKTLEKTYPADFENKDLAGTTRKISVTVKQIKVKKLPDLDDELAQDVSEKFKTLDDLKADIRRNLERRLETRLRQLKEKAVVDALLERSEVELPKSMVDAELAMRWRNFVQQTTGGDENQMARLLSMTGRTAQSIIDEWRPSAEKAIRTRLILEKLTEEGKYEATEEDQEREYAKMAEESSLSVDEVKAEYKKHDALEYLKDRIREDKLMDAILAEAKVKKGKKTAFVDLFKESE
ncbi:MAG: trigger factor [Treponema sp.]|nr:trigger factor [Treponema sp.]